MGYLKSACGISSSLCTAAVSTLDWFSPLGLGWQWCRGSGGAEAGQADEESCFKTNPLFVRPQPLHLRGRTSDLSPLLPVFLLLLLFEWLGFHGIGVFLGWLKINSEVKNGEKKNGIMFRHSVLWVKHLRSLVMMTYSEKTRYLSLAGVFL